MLVVRARGAAARRRAIFGVEGAVFHGLELGHLLEDLAALGLE